VGNSSTPA
jgi:hypothetical protein